MEMSFEDILIYSSGGHLVLRSQNICEFLVESIMRNISVKLFKILNSGSRDVFKN